MSKLVDERVVEMRFDNKDFESNVKTSMSTLDKLKAALKLPDTSSKTSLNNLSGSVKTATSNVNGLNTAVNTVKASFSALDVVGATAIANITNGIVNASKNLISSFTIAPIMDGFREYETQMNSVQTILANTASKGTTMSEVTAALDELNTYADQTIYNFAEMTKNIGTFTAAGVDLDKSVAAIKGIANLGAMSGSTSAQVSTAMYQLSQALAAGKVSLQDWNSVVTAGMGGEQFQNALKRTAEHFGTNVDAMIKKYGSFRESLTRGGWLTAEVLTETLNQIGGAYDETALKAQGYSDTQIQEILQMAQTAEEAATKVKTFTQLMSTLSEAAGSGWAKSFQLILGDFEEARNFFTNLSDYLGAIIEGTSNARNNVLEEAFGSDFSKITKQVQEAGVPLDTFTDKLKEVAKASYNVDLDKMAEQFGSLDLAMQNIPRAGDMVVDTIKALAGAGTTMNDSTTAMTDKLEYFQKVVDEVWKGNFKNAPERYELLAEAGYDYAQVQDLVNKTVDGHKLTLEDLSDTQLKAIGYTDQEVSKLRELAEQAEKSGTSLNELIENMNNNKQSGRQLFLDSILNTVKAIAEPLKAVGQAFGEVFAIDPTNMYGAIEALNKFTAALVIDEGTYDNIVRISKGIFGIFNIFTTFGTGAFGIAFKALTAVLEQFNLGILDVLAFMGDLVYAFSEFVTSGEPIIALFDAIKSAITDSTGPIGEFVKKFQEIFKISEPLEDAIEMVKELWNVLLTLARTSFMEGPMEAFALLQSYLSSISWDSVLSGLSQIGPAISNAFSAAVAAAQEIGPDIIAGLQNGLSSGVSKAVQIMQEIGQRIIEAICAVLGIHSPSTVMYEIGQNIVQGLINGIKSLIDGVFDIFTNIKDNISELFGVNINWGTILGVGVGAGLFITLNNILKVAEQIGKFSAPFEAAGKAISNVSDILGELKNTLQKLQGVLKFRIAMEGVKSLGVTIALLVGSIALLTFVDQSKLLGAAVVVVIITGIVAGLAYLAMKLSELDSKAKTLDVAKTAGMLFSISTSLLILAGAMAIMSNLNPAGLKQAVETVTLFGAIIVALAAVSRFAGGTNLTGVSKLIRSVSTSFLLLGVAVKIMGSLSQGELEQATAIITTFGAVIAALTLVSNLGKGMSGLGYTIKQFSAAMIILAAAMKILGSMEWGELRKAVTGLGSLTAIIGILVAITNLGGKKIDNIGKTIMQFSIAMGILALALKVIGTMEWGELGKAIVGVTALGAIVSGLVFALKYAGGENEMLKIGSTLIAMSVAVGILAAVCVVLGMIDIESLAKGITAVGILSAFVAGLTIAARGVEDIKGTMMGMAVAIGVLAASLAILSFIDTDRLLTAATGLGAVIAAFGFALKSAGNMKGVKLTSLILMIAALAGVAGSLYILAQLPMDNLIGTATSLSALLIALSVSMRIISGVGKLNPASTLTSFGTLMMVLLALAGALSIINGMNLQTSLTNVAALSTLLIAMSAACKILGTIKSVDASAYGAMLVLTLVVGALAQVISSMSGVDFASSIPNALALGVLINALASACAILGTIRNVDASAYTSMLVLTLIMVALADIMKYVAQINPTTAIPNMTALATVLTIMSGVCAILGTIKKVNSSAIAAMALLSLVVYELGYMLQAVSDLDINMSLESMASLSGILIALSAVTVILGHFGGGTLAPAAEGAAAMGTIVAIITTVVTAIGGIVDALDSIGFDVVAKIETAGEVLQGVGEAIGGLVGGLIGGGLEALSDSLPGIGENLATFFEKLQPMFDGMSSLTPESGAALESIGKALLAFTAGDLLSQLSSFFGGESDLSGFIDNIGPFGEALATFGNSVKDVNVEQMQGAAKAGQALAELANSLPTEGGWADTIFGSTQSMTSFGESLVSFGESLATFSGSVGDIDVEKIQSVAAAGQALAELADSLPKEEGWMQKIFGETTDVASFGEQLVAFGDSLATFSTSCADIETDNITAAQPAITAVTDMAKKIAELKTGGMLDAITGGEMNLTAFGEQLNNFAIAMKDFARILSEGKVDPTLISDVTSSVRSLASFIKSNANAETNITKGIETIKKMKDVGTPLSTLSGVLKDVKSEAISAATTAITNLRGTIEGLVGLDTSGIATFKTAIDELSTVNVQGLVDAFSNASSQLVDVGANLMSSLSQGISSGSSAVIAAAQQVMVSLASMIGQAALVFSTGGLAIAQNLAKGITQGAPLVRVAAMAAVTNAAGGIRAAYSSFYSAGRYLCSGMAAGITAGSYTVRARAAAMARAAATAAEAALDINSPSKVFRKIGKSVPEGFAQGISLMGTSVKESAKTMSVDAIETTRRVIDKMGSLIDGDFDVNPVISPVIDLDNVQNGVASINGMLGNMEPITLMANVGSINRMMSQRNQNGEYGEVVSAINKLDESLSALERPSYNVGGITYDDGSVVAGAVNQLIRATRIERRM